MRNAESQAATYIARTTDISARAFPHPPSGFSVECIPQSTIHNPHFPSPQSLAPSPQPLAPSPAPRSGVTLVEVLISMTILAIGLLGAAAMFPVGGYFMQKGEIADRSAAIAQAAFADLVARGDLNPENWQVWHPDNTTGYIPMGQFARDWMVNNRNANDFQINMNQDAGFVYIIDPLGTASGIRNGVTASRMSKAPIDADSSVADVTTIPSVDEQSEDLWTNQFPGWPVKRLSSSATKVGNVPSEPIAQSIYSSSDDLAFSVDDQDVPTRQRVVGPDTDGDGNPDSALARESRGDYSWMAMVAPTTSEAREALALDPSAHYFDVSVIVFYKRPISNIETSERLTRGKVISRGTGGGEILIAKLQNDPGDPFEELKTGQWVMVSGPHPTSTEARPLFFTQWYRVLAIDDQVRGDLTNSETQRLIGLRGPDWPWNAGGSVRVGLFPGAVAVHTKTMRLETPGAYQ